MGAIIRGMPNMTWTPQRRERRKIMVLWQIKHYRLEAIMLDRLDPSESKETKREPLRQPFSEAEFVREMDRPFWTGRS